VSAGTGREARAGRALVVVGLGNIGSQVVPLLAGLPGVTLCHLVDPDVYESGNIGRQRIQPADVGKSKARVQSRHLRGLAPAMEVRAWPTTLEAVPLGVLRGAVVLGCVDSRRARQSINRAALWAGVPWIDAAIDAGGRVRVAGYRPGGACLECGWGPGDYDALEQRHPCQRGPVVPTPTDAPAELGAVAAALQVATARELLAGLTPETAPPQWCLDVPHRAAFAARFDVNPRCRQPHGAWVVTTLAAAARDLTLGDVFGRMGWGVGTEFGVGGQFFVRRQRCPHCGHTRGSRLRLSRRLVPRACPRCGSALRPAAADVAEVLVSGRMRRAVLAWPLAALGLEDQDIFTLVSPEGVRRHFELGAGSGGPQDETEPLGSPPGGSGALAAKNRREALLPHRFSPSRVAPGARG
jgi:molybdopterin/thiamine biosynthesis adenylyltransferase